jgi:hypothetical protein
MSSQPCPTTWYVWTARTCALDLVQSELVTPSAVWCTNTTSTAGAITGGALTIDSSASQPLRLV